MVEETLRTEARAESLEQVYDALECFWARLERAGLSASGQRWQLELATATVEVVANVIEHAYSTDAADRPLGVRLAFFADRAEALIVDRGRPYTPDPIGSPPDLDELPEGGWGLVVARAAVDELSYGRSEQGENRWRLLRRLPDEPSSARRP